MSAFTATRPRLPRLPWRKTVPGRHTVREETWSDVELRELRDIPDPLRDTGEIPVLADAQRALIASAQGPAPRHDRALLARVRDGLRGIPGEGHPFAAPVPAAPQQPRQDAPRLRPLPPRLPKTAHPAAAEARREIEALPLPINSTYADYLRRVGRITGTGPVRFLPQPEGQRELHRLGSEYDETEQRRRAEFDAGLDVRLCPLDETATRGSAA